MSEHAEPIVESDLRLENRRTNRWRGEFPYHWDADELVSRRELLQFAVYTSGALFASTAFLALLGLYQTLQPAAVAKEQLIARVGDVPEGAALYFNYPRPDDQAMLLHLPGDRFVAYSQRCTHLSCAVYYQSERGRLFCPCHEGVFDPQTGEPVAGPPQRRLAQITLQRRGDAVYAVAEEA
jgi:nitrite reductase/ring-hydroxylating ferredoxin subunit